MRADTVDVVAVLRNVCWSVLHRFHHYRRGPNQSLSESAMLSIRDSIIVRASRRYLLSLPYLSITDDFHLVPCRSHH